MLIHKNILKFQYLREKMYASILLLLCFLLSNSYPPLGIFYYSFWGSLLFASSREKLLKNYFPEPYICLNGTKYLMEMSC